MAIDIKTIGTFGISFSKELDQTWFNLWRKDDGYSMDLYQFVEDEDSDEEDEIIDTSVKITFEEGEGLLKSIMEQGRLEDWKPQYGSADEGIPTDLAWTIDIDDTSDADLLFISGNGKFPPDDLMKKVILAIQTKEPTFGACFKDFR